MKVDKDTLSHLENLAKLNFSDAEKDKMVGDFEKIVGFVDKLNELDTDGVEPKIYVNDEFDNLREDIAIATTTTKEALKNSPKKDTFYIRVPKVLK